MSWANPCPENIQPRAHGGSFMPMAHPYSSPTHPEGPYDPSIPRVYPGLGPIHPEVLWGSLHV